MSNEVTSIDTTGTSEIMMNVPLLQQIDHMATQMASAKCTVPKHLQGSTGDCAAIIMQAVQWRMNPYSVAQKTHLVNGTLGYEAQLVNAVICNSGLMQGAFKYEYKGEGQALSCRVGAVLRGESEITWGQWLSLGSVKIQNSHLWKTNPSQQLGYLQVKNWGRAYTPGAILGVYTPDELLDPTPAEREVNIPSSNTDAPAPSRTSALKEKLGVEEAEDAEVVEDSPASSATFADVTAAINNADSAETLNAAKDMMMSFVENGDNDQFKSELGEAYRWKLSVLKEQTA